MASAPVLTADGRPRPATYARWAATHAARLSASGAPSWSSSREVSTPSGSAPPSPSVAASAGVDAVLAAL